jgi:hypothetical protein
MATTEINPNNPNDINVVFNSNGFVNVKTSTLVKLSEVFIVETENGPKQLVIEISADFNTIDKKYHEIFFNAITSKYLNRVSFGNNPFSECRPIKKRKWYQFWKSEYFM